MATIFVVAVAVGPAGWQTARASDSGVIVITVRDTTSRPVEGARVTIIGPSLSSSLTPRRGIVRYTDVPSGIYRARIRKAGYQAVISVQFDVVPDANVALDVVLSRDAIAARPSDLKQIGAVRSKVAISAGVSEDSPIWRISDSLTEALSTLAGMDVVQDSNDPNASQTLSLRGMGASQTAVTLDGIPMGPPGSAVDLRAINTDLVTGAAVSFDAQPAALGGSLNLRTAQPTQTWQLSMKGSYGTFDKFSTQMGATGSVGALGLAFTHSRRGGNNPLTFRDYLDQSGLSYPHGGESTATGDMLKLRIPLNARTTLTATALQNQQGAASLCTLWITTDPCGIGPGNTQSSALHFASFSGQSLVGEIGVTLALYGTDSHQNLDEPNRFIAGTATPYQSTTSIRSRGFTASTTASLGRHTFTASTTARGATIGFFPHTSVVNAPFVLPVIGKTAFRTYDLADSYKPNDALTIVPRISLASVTGVNLSVLGGIAASWVPAQRDSYRGSLSFGTTQARATQVDGYSEPQQAQLNCSERTAIVTGPGDSSGGQSSLGYDLSWAHRGRRGSVEASFYRSVQSGQAIAGWFDETGSIQALAPGYAAQIAAYYALPTNCGNAAALQNLFVTHTIANATEIYQGMNVTARTVLGKSVTVAVAYSVTSAFVSAVPAHSFDAASTIIAGSQLPGRPLHKGSLTLDAHIPAAELIANLAYTGPNNAQHIAPYLLLSAGVTRPLGRGQLTVFESNVFNTQAGFFATHADATPIALSNGNRLYLTALPNHPRELTVSYSFRAALRAAPVPPANTAPSDGPRLTFPPRPAGVDPFAPAVARADCTPGRAALAKRGLVEMRDALDAARAGTMPAGATGAFTARLYGDPNASWYVQFGLHANVVAPGPDNLRKPFDPRALAAGFNAVLSCGYWRVLNDAERRSYGIETNGKFQFGYHPGIGLFLIQPVLTTGGGPVKQ